VPVTSAPETLEQNAMVASTTTTQQPDEEATTATTQKKSTANTSAPKTITHVVAAGENLTSLANRYHVSTNDLRAWNELDASEQTILAGDTLVVGVSDRSTSTAKVERISTRKVVSHKVKRGETLAEIADRYNTTTTSIRKLNRMGSRSTIKYGTNLKVETTVVTTRNVAKAPSPAKDDSEYYKVRRGDTLSSIADKFDVSIAELRDLNPSLKKTSVVRIGQRLRLQ
jgi:membrane-bound lytic murein transglycosylase D